MLDKIIYNTRKKIRDHRFITIVAIISFLFVILINHYVFPYYSNNHDEGVYIFQAKMLAQGNIYLDANDYSEFFDSWFFVNDGDKIYPRYTPVHALFLSIFYLLGDMRLAIGAISVLNIIFIYLIAKEIYGKDIAKIATIICLSSPLFLIISSTYLSYTSSLLLTTIFIYYFIKSLNNDSKKYPIFSGLALGLLFFNRTFDAVLVGTPFMIYLSYKVMKDIKILNKLCIIIISFIPIFLVTLLYNYILTEDPLLFPFNKYEALDTLGFGLKRMSPYSPIYIFDINSSINATGIFLYQLLFNWTSAGILFLGFLLYAMSKIYNYKLSEYEKLLLMYFMSVIIGNLIYWGPYNFSIWGEALYMYGPTYYFNLLIPISIISGQMIVIVSEKIGKIRYNIIPVILGIIILTNIFLIIPKIDINYKYSEKNARLYSPIVDNNISNSLIFIPAIYGPFLQHPLGYLVNDPSFNSSIVYSRDLGKIKDIRLMKKYKDRNYYTFGYDGIYTESYDDNIKGKLTRLYLVESKNIELSTPLTNPTDSKIAIAYVWNNGNFNSYILDSESKKGDQYNVTWNISSKNIILEGSIKNIKSQLKLPSSDLSNDLSSEEPIIIGFEFTNSSISDAIKVYEYRYSFDIYKDKITLLLPAEIWKNVDFQERSDREVVYFELKKDQPFSLIEQKNIEIILPNDDPSSLLYVSDSEMHEYGIIFDTNEKSVSST